MPATLLFVHSSSGFSLDITLTPTSLPFPLPPTFLFVRFRGVDPCTVALALQRLGDATPLGLAFRRKRKEDHVKFYFYSIQM